VKVAIYPGTFDPITRGHEDLIQRGLAFADRVIVGVTSAGGKAPLFTLEERVALARECLGTEPRFEVQPFEGLLVDFARQVGNSRGVLPFTLVLDRSGKVVTTEIGVLKAEKLESLSAGKMGYGTTEVGDLVAGAV